MVKDYIKWIMSGVVLFSIAQLSPVFAQDSEQAITHAQSELSKQDLTIFDKNGKKHVFSVEIAKTLKEQQIGEMFRTSVPDNGGMLFVWPYPQESQMWMKNTLVPLDMVFINAQHKIQAIEENTVPKSLAVISSHGPVIATLELQGGITKKLGITVGNKVESAALQSSSNQTITTQSK